MDESVADERVINVLDETELTGFINAAEGGKSPDIHIYEKSFEAAMKDVASHPKIIALADAAAERGGGIAAAKQVHHRAAELTKELHAMMSPPLSAATCAVARFMLNRVYAGIIYDRAQLTALQQLCAKARAERRSVILMPSHKSHIDYIVLQYSFRALELGALAIAAGENLNIRVMGNILRRNGAFFIRRSFHGPDGELYSAVVAAYLEAMLHRGCQLMFFPEGGRSRSGKLLQPKLGMLGMLMDPILQGSIEDAYIVPVSIHYDRVMETKTYARELLGAKKEKENFRGVLSQGSHLISMNDSRYGNIHVRIAPPIAAKSYIVRHISMQRQSGSRPSFDPRQTSSERGVLLKALAYQVFDEINRVSSVTPASLVGTILLTTMGRGIGRSALILKLDWLRKEVVKSGGHISHLFDFQSELAPEAVDSALVVLGPLVTTVQDLLEPVYCVTPGSHFELSYYRNMLVHVFIHQSIIAVVLHRFCHLHPDEQRMQREALSEEVRYLSRMLKLEFVFSGIGGEDQSSTQSGFSQGEKTVATALMRNSEHALDMMVSEGIIDYDGNHAVDLSHMVRRVQGEVNGGYQFWNKHLMFLCSLVWPVIESYWLVSAGLLFIFRYKAKMQNKQHMVKCFQAFAKTLVHMGFVHYHEAASEEALKKALETFEDMGVYSWHSVAAENGEVMVSPQLGEKYVGNDSELIELSKFVDQLASFRRRWPDQYVVSAYPHYIAELAFGITSSAKL